MSGFVVDTESLVDVANSLQTLQGVLHSIATDSFPAADIGGVTIGQEVTNFNTHWTYGVGQISGEVQNLTLALFKAAAHYDHTEQQVADRSHNTPSGSAPVVAGHPTPGPVHPRPAPHPKPRHPTPAKHHEPAKHPTHHDRGTGTGTTTIGGPRLPGTGAGTGTTTIGGNPDGHHDHKKGSGTATITIGPGGTTVQTGPGQGHGTTVIGPNNDGGATIAGHSCTVHSDLLTSHQATFVGTLAALTGLSPRVVGAWCLSEESGSSAAARQADGDNNWLNIQTGADPSAWRDPTAAAQQTAKFLQGQWGGASSSIQGIAGSGSGTAEHQLAAITGSDWAADHFDGGHLLHETYGQLSGMTVTEH